MHYIKLGPIRIPCRVNQSNGKKSLRIAGIRIPFSTYTDENKKYYQVGPITFHFPHQDKWMIDQRRSNFLDRDRMDQAQIEKTAREIFREKLGYELNLEEPKTLNEKIFWLKMYYHDPLITKCCDKFCVKEYVNEKLGPGYVIPTIASWERAEDIDFSALPDRYVLKVNWASGYNIIVSDPSQVQEEKFRQRIAHWMEPEQNSYFQAFNWGYKDMKPVVYAEEYMEQSHGQLYDYKFFCFHGVCRYMLVATNRTEKNGLTFDFFDLDFNWMDISQGGRAHAWPRPERPMHFEEMIRCAQLLAEPFPFVRVDFYEVQGKLYVGEMTFYPGGGILPYDPAQWDARLGEYLQLPNQK